MMREKYESLPLATLKDLAKARGLKGISTMKKAELIDRAGRKGKRGLVILQTKNPTLPVIGHA